MVVHSGWMPNEEQVAQLGGGAHVRLSVWQYPIPPLAVSVEPPVCACHSEPMEWDGEDFGYYCCRLTVQDKDVGPLSRDRSPLEAARRDFEPEEEPTEDP